MEQSHPLRRVAAEARFIAGYLGESTIFDSLVAGWATAYADQVADDHEVLRWAFEEGRDLRVFRRGRNLRVRSESKDTAPTLGWCDTDEGMRISARFVYWTTAIGTCTNCGATEPVGAVHVFRGAGIVLRCAHCDNPLVKIVKDGTRLWMGFRESRRLKSLSSDFDFESNVGSSTGGLPIRRARSLRRVQ